MTVVNHCMIEDFGPVCNHKNGVKIMCGKELERISIESGAKKLLLFEMELKKIC